MVMANGGCQIVSLKDQRRGPGSRFPKMLFELRRLRILTIDRGSVGLMGPKKLGLALQSLSSTLTELNLTCLEADACWLLNPPPDSNFSPKGGGPGRILRLSNSQGFGLSPAISRDWEL
jgi:hypothetical protein